MPEGYLKMKRAFKKKGMGDKAAKKKAARIWNSKHPGNPVGRGEQKRGRTKKRGR